MAGHGLNVDAFNKKGNSALTMAATGEVVELLCTLDPNLLARPSPKHPSQLDFYVAKALKQDIDPVMAGKLAALLPYVKRCRTKLQEGEEIIERAVNRMAAPSKPEEKGDNPARSKRGRQDDDGDDGKTVKRRRVDDGRPPDQPTTPIN